MADASPHEPDAYAMFVKSAAAAAVTASDLARAGKAAKLEDFTTTTEWNRALYAWERCALAQKVSDRAGKPLWQPCSAAEAVAGIRAVHLAELQRILGVLHAGCSGKAEAEAEAEERDIVGAVADRVRKVEARFHETEAILTGASAGTAGTAGGGGGGGTSATDAVMT